MENRCGKCQKKRHNGKNGGKKSKKNCHCRKKCSEDATPLIMIDDFTNFDGFIATILLQKAKNIDLRLLVASKGFSQIGPGINNLFNMLSWFGNNKTKVVPGSYFADQEVEAGPNPTFGATPPSERTGQLAQPIFQMFVPPLWQDNASTLYGTVGQIPLNKNPDRQYLSVAPTPGNPFIPARDHIAEVLGQVRLEGKRAIIFNTGPLTDLAKFFEAYGNAYNDSIEEVVIMGGGFFNFANPDDSTSQRWAGNIFSDQAFPLSPVFGNLTPPPGYDYNPGDWEVKPPFHTMQEFNVFLDPAAAQAVFDHLYNNNIRTRVIPTDATDPLLIANGLDALQDSPTPEGRYVSDLLYNLRLFEGGAFDFVIRLWDIIAALAILNPEVIDESQSIKAKISVHQLDDIEALKRVACDNPLKNPYNVMTYDPYVGQTTLVEDPNSSITVVRRVNRELALQAIIDRLNSQVNSACRPANYYINRNAGSSCGSKGQNK